MSVRADSRSSAADRQRRQSGDEGIPLGAAGAEQHDDRVGREPARGEHQRVDGGTVGDVEVVDHDGDRAVLGVAAEQAQHGGADREPVAASRRRAAAPGSASAADSASACTAGIPSSAAERRTHQLQEHAERDLALRLETGRAQDPHLGEPRHGVLEQRGLADPRLADESEHAARPQAGSRPRAGRSPAARPADPPACPESRARAASRLGGCPGCGVRRGSSRESQDTSRGAGFVRRAHRTEPGSDHVHHRRTRPRSTPTSS